ncbi:phage major tail protein, TP901-1 family [Limosilactobacillus fermentum]|uniref:phage major tail protein, TP901-1 family n=1 Tax=Limosilactobacillus fermentum TaxID=1613 RepID=UPI00187E4059|nr:phage major tail protein, TP901-1 family [Limosilactobacillus fermentum]MBE8118131.1 phage major tail protein, TP901-1 family [Limosilactobacillus fermentum]
MAEVTTIEGKQVFLLVRKLSEATKTVGQIVPFQESLDFEIKTDDDTTTTKTGKVSKPTDPETEVKTKFIDNFSNIADQLYDSVLDGDILDVWIVNYQRKKGAKYFAWSMRGKVSEDSGSNDADDNSERELTFKITAGPKRGWTDITAETEAAMAYVFRGIGKIEGEAKNDGTDGGGLAWTAEDAGVGTLPEA